MRIQAFLTAAAVNLKRLAFAFLLLLRLAVEADWAMSPDAVATS